MTRKETIEKLIDVRNKAEITRDEVAFINMAIKALDQAPRKGHWIKRHDNVGWWYVCDKCGSTPLWDENTREVVLSPYCPNCGADMRGEE